MLTEHPQRYRARAREVGKDPIVVERALATAAIQQEIAPGVPVVLTLMHLAALTGVPYGALRRFVSRRLGDPYNVFRLHKASKAEDAAYRIIAVPPPLLMTAQRWIGGNILAKGQPHHASVAYAPGSSILKAAERHCGARWLIKLDARRFFESISEIQVYRVFRHGFGYQPLIALELARLCTRLRDPELRRFAPQWGTENRRYTEIGDYRVPMLGHLPQGAATSPMLANLAVVGFDREMTKLAARQGMTYTRYADDLTLSTSEPAFGRHRAAMVVRDTYTIMGRHGLSPNTTKTNVVPPGARKVVLGLLVDGDRPRLTREFKDSLRMHLHYCEKPGIGPAIHARKRGFVSVIGLRNHLRGLIAFAGQVEPDLSSTLSKRMEMIAWPL